MAYEPRGKVGQLLEAMRADPGRVWTSQEAAKVMDVHQGALTAHLNAAIKHGKLHRKLEHGRCQYSLRPFSLPELQIPKLGSYVPPKMTAPRPGTDLAAPARAPGTPPAPAKPVHAGQPVADVPAEAGPAPAPASSTTAEELEKINMGLARRLMHAVKWEQPKDQSAPVAAAPEADPLPQDRDEAEEEVFEPDAFISCRTGEIVLVGLEPDEEGRVTIPAELAALIRRQTAWSAPR